MKIEKVTYQKTYSIGPYLTDRVGFEATVGHDWVKIDGVNTWETVDIALSNLEKIADEWHRKAHPRLYQEASSVSVQLSGYEVPASTLTTSSSTGPYVIDLNHEKMEIAIDNCTSEDELKQWKEANPVIPVPILKHYMNRLKELTNGK